MNEYIKALRLKYRAKMLAKYGRKAVDSRITDVLDSILGAGTIDMAQYRQIESLGALDRVIRVVLNAKLITKAELRAILRGQWTEE